VAPTKPAPLPLYAPFEGPIGTLYAELVERTRAEGSLLPGTPGTLALRPRADSGAYWYRRYYGVPGQPQVEQFVCRQDDAAACEAMRLRIEAAEWSTAQVRSLKHLGLQVADKDVARVLVEAHNLGWFSAGLAIVGTLAFMSWLNELGVRAIASRTQDLDLARRQPLKLAAAVPFRDAMAATGLRFVEVPGLQADAPPTSLKRPGREGLRVDLLTAGPKLGQAVHLPELQWHAQAVPNFDYLLEAARPMAVLAGGHCVPARAPAPERMAWHKLYSSTRRGADTAKAEKDLKQAATLLAVLVERDNLDLVRSAAQVPGELLRAARRRVPSLRQLLSPHPQALEEVLGALSG
jgi:hypothetical protein